MKKFKYTFQIDDEVKVTVSRPLNKEEYTHHKFIPLFHDGDLSMFMIIREDPLILPRIYAGLVMQTGDSENSYDDYKGSFSFRFKVEVNKNDKISYYLLNMMHYRECINYLLYQVVDASDAKRDGVYSEPDENLFSSKDIKTFCLCLSSYMECYGKQTDKFIKPFVLSADSNYFICGYLDGNFFSETHKDHEMYREELKKKKEKVDNFNREFEEGYKIGQENAAIEIARKLLKLEYTLEQISEWTGLSIEKIRSL